MTRDEQVTHHAIQKIGKNQPSLRDQFAMASLAGMDLHNTSIKNISSGAYQIADAMLKERTNSNHINPEL